LRTLRITNCAIEYLILVSHWTTHAPFAPQDSKKKTLSLLITRCEYGILRLGDDRTKPTRLEVLQSDLIDRLGDVITGKTLTVQRYTIFRNDSVNLRNNVYSNQQGIVAGVMRRMGTDCPKEKVSGGWYAAEEVTTQMPPYIAELEATLDGTPHSVRVVFSLEPPKSGSFKVKEHGWMLVVMHKTADALTGSTRKTASAQPSQ
jgi:hypothetical protein